jgi:hypothetical protein
MGENIPLSDNDFETAVRFSDKAYRDDSVRANDAFVAAMNAAVKRGKETVRAGTYVDLTPPIGHIRIRGNAIFSACGSPAAMCLDVGSHDGGAATLK